MNKVWEQKLFVSYVLLLTLKELFFFQKKVFMPWNSIENFFALFLTKKGKNFFFKSLFLMRILSRQQGWKLLEIHLYWNRICLILKSMNFCSLRKESLNSLPFLELTTNDGSRLNPSRSSQDKNSIFYYFLVWPTAYLAKYFIQTSKTG